MDAILKLELVLSIMEARAKEMRHKSKAMPFADKFGRGHYSGYAAATQMDIELLMPVLTELREERAEEQVEEPFNSYDEKVGAG